MTRGRKLMIVGMVLAIGFGLAWPFRKSPFQDTQQPKNFDTVAETSNQLTAPVSSYVARKPLVSPQTPLPAPPVTAQMANITESQQSTTNVSPRATFDLANHPALANSPIPSQKQSPVTGSFASTSPVAGPQTSPAAKRGNQQTSVSAYAPSQDNGSRPVYSTGASASNNAHQDQRLQEFRHIVQNNDTLEKLAKRYLGDEGRALEIFDLNRDVLDNPYLLPIDAELRLPSDAKVTLD